MHSEKIQQMNSEIKRLEAEAKECEDFEERNEKFDQIEILSDQIFNLELNDWVTEVKTEVKNFFKIS
tara:strand:- start:79 stop:279 length:201 start_codon:yes stop_codon:yes gene_type:complete